MLHSPATFKSHCLNLALVHTSKLPCVRTMMSTVQDIAVAFGYSGKRLEAFSNELQQDTVTRDRLDGRQKLKTLCETRGMSRADSLPTFKNAFAVVVTRGMSRADFLSTFKNAFAVVVHALETLEADNDEKAGGYVNANLRFSFIITLVTCEYVLVVLVGLTAILQQVNMDLLEAVREAGVVVKILRDERQYLTNYTSLLLCQTCHARTHDNSTEQTTRLRTQKCIKSRVSLYNTFVDLLIQEITERVIKNDDRFCAQLLLQSRLDELQESHISAIFDRFSDDIGTTKGVFDGKVKRWSVRWSDASVTKPNTLLGTIGKTVAVAYPGIYSVLSVLITMPATSASCERSFSSMRYIKSYLKSTMTGDRLSCLAILHIHRDVDVDAIVNKFASVKCRNINFV